MKQLRCLCLLLAVCLCLSCVSLNVYAANETTYIATYPLMMTGEIRVGDINSGSSISYQNFYQRFASDGVSGDISYTGSSSSGQLSTTGCIATFKVYRNDPYILFNKGDKVNINLDGLLVYYGANPISSTKYAFLVTANEFWCKVYFSDGTYKFVQLAVDSLKLNCPSGKQPYLYFENSFTATADIIGLEYYIYFDKDCFNVAYNSSQCVYIGSYLTDCDMTYTIISDDTVEIRDGVLGIIDKLTTGFSGLSSSIGNLPNNIWNKMNGSFNSLIGSTGDILSSVGSVVTYLNKLPSDMWNKMSSSFGDLIAGNESLLSSTGDILGYTSSLPTNIWNKMSGSFGNLISSAGNIYSTLQDMPGLVWGEMKDTFTSIKTNTLNMVTDIKNLPTLVVDGVKNSMEALWVPDEDELLAFKDDCSSIVKSHFGAAYECVDYIKDFAEAFQEKEAIDVLHFPSITLKFAGTDFVFGGYEVDLIHDDMEANVEYLKWGISMVCTFATVNSLKNRFVHEFLEA